MNQSETKELLETAKTMLARSDLSLMQKIPILIKIFAGLESGEICCRIPDQTQAKKSILKECFNQLQDVIKDEPLWLLGFNRDSSSNQEYPFAVKNLLETLQADDQTIKKIKGVLEALEPAKNPKPIPEWKKKPEILASFVGNGVTQASGEVHITEAMLDSVSKFLKDNKKLLKLESYQLLGKAVKEQKQIGARSDGYYVLSYDLLGGVVTDWPIEDFIHKTGRLNLERAALLWRLENPTSKKPELDFRTGVKTWEDYLPPGDDLLS